MSDDQDHPAAVQRGRTPVLQQTPSASNIINFLNRFSPCWLVQVVTPSKLIAESSLLTAGSFQGKPRCRQTRPRVTSLPSPSRHHNWQSRTTIEAWSSTNHYRHHAWCSHERCPSKHLSVIDRGQDLLVAKSRCLSTPVTRPNTVAGKQEAEHQAHHGEKRFVTLLGLPRFQSFSQCLDPFTTAERKGKSRQRDQPK